MEPNYWDYLQLEGLLELQDGLPGDRNGVGNDEPCFIVVHQAYELWFKVVLRELKEARDRLLPDPLPEAEIPAVVRHLTRVTDLWAVRTVLLKTDALPPLEGAGEYGFVTGS
jgi:tryptophan 2,3-dioxygenase